MVSRFLGDVNLEEGMLVDAAMTPGNDRGPSKLVLCQVKLSQNKLFYEPIGAGLHDPVVICWPLVIGKSTVAQKLMKLLEEVNDATWPAVAFA